MEQLYKEMQERLRYLEAQELTEEIKWRIAEITLSIVRVQQLLLANINGRSEQFYCADWNRCGSICEEQCNACNKAEKMPEVAQENCH